jgi:MYXO-CTERM domain-containing protein
VGVGSDEDPLLTILLEDFAADFYVFSDERYVRFMTFSGDVSIALDADASGSEVQFAVASVTTANATVTNSDLLSEPPEELAELIDMVLTSFAGQLASSIPPVTLPTIMGFGLEIPDNGVVGISDAGEEFLSIFANLSVDGNAVTATPETSASLTEAEIDPESLKLANLARGEGPRATIEARADGRLGARFEYSHRLDNGPWSPWTAETTRVIDDRQLRLQMRHVVEVRSRVAGESRTTDLTPAKVDVLVDRTAPEVSLARTDEGILIHGWDAVSSPEALSYRMISRGGDASLWLRFPSATFTVPMPFDDEAADVEVKDESGNVRRTTAALIRGGANPNRAASSCDCRVPAGSGSIPGAGWALLALAALIGARRRVRRVSRAARRASPAAWLFGAALALSLAAGCSCDDPKKESACGEACPAEFAADSNAGQICCEPEKLCVDYDRSSFCDPGYICEEGALSLDEACALACANCVVKPALEQGQIGKYLDVAAGSEGEVVVSGYSAGNIASNFGDLVVGTLDTPTNPGQAANAVDWEIIEGAPDSPITNDPSGWRGGVSAPGDDVGMYTSIESSGGTFYVAYYDRTAGALKVAIGAPGAWTTHVVDDAGDSGRHASLALDGAGKPVIAYLRIERGDAGTVKGSVRVATAASATPTSAADWALAVVTEKTVACRPSFCAEGETCLEDGNCVTETEDCEDCGGDEVCANGTCELALGEKFVDDWAPTVGLYASLVRTSSGFALVYYDRTDGSLYGARFEGNAWSAPFLIDGYALGTPNSSDSGVGASLAVDAEDTWHVVYVDGTNEALKYARVVGTDAAVSTIDEGTDNGLETYADGRHVVGDDASIAVLSDGTLQVIYQDATSLTTLRATNTGEGWSRSVLDETDHGGYWPAQLPGADATSTVVFWWRGAGADRAFGVRAVTLAAP